MNQLVIDQNDFNGIGIHDHKNGGCNSTFWKDRGNVKIKAFGTWIIVSSGPTSAVYNWHSNHA